MAIQDTPSREEQALLEIGQTTVSKGVARLLVALFLLSVVAVPGLQTLAEWRGTAGPAEGPQPLARLAPQIRDLAGRLPTVGRVFEERGFMAADRELLAAIDAFETRLEEASVLRSRLLPPVQRWLSDWLGLGNEQAYLGRGRWLFYRPDVDYVVGPGFLDAAVLRRRSQGGDPGQPPPQPDPVAALLDFARQLRRRGIDLLVVPTPGKPVIHPERFSRLFDGSVTPVQNPSFRTFKERLGEAGIAVVDVALVLKRASPDDAEPRFLRTDTHWTPAAMERAAAEISQRIRQRLPESDQLRQEYFRRSATVENLGDIAKMLRLPAGQQLFLPERAETSLVLTLEGRPWKADRGAEVLLLGDSFTNVYSDPGLGWGAAAGLAEQLSFQLRRPLDRIALNAGGSHASRLALAREIAAGRDRLRGKKLVIYQFAARELAIGDWKLIDLGLL